MTTDPIFKATQNTTSRIEDLAKRIEGLANIPTITNENKEKLMTVLSELKSAVMICNQTLMKVRVQPMNHHQQNVLTNDAINSRFKR
jgi:hypothetical protein